MGTIDPLQIDSMGGTRLVTSKIAIIGPSECADADVDYNFAQVGIEEDGIGYEVNCGNISAGVGPFAIDEGLIKGAFRKGTSASEANLLCQSDHVPLFCTPTPNSA
jgi:2-methylaconitate cis-trans-isomerase PrpF